MTAILAASKIQTSRSPQTTETLLFDDSFFADEEDAQTALNIYREKFIPQFPFVVIPPNTTPLELRQTKPFLYRVIILITCQRSSSHQQILSDLVDKYYIQSIVVNRNQNLDLLQGLLVFLGW